jgi:hypothetical protein
MLSARVEECGDTGKFNIHAIIPQTEGKQQ